MRRHPLDIFHEGNGVPENTVIDTLQDVAYGHACLMERHAVRVVDVAAAVHCGTSKLALDVKLACNSADIVLFAHNQSLFG
jgi:hypothetical protein